MATPITGLALIVKEQLSLLRKQLTESYNKRFVVKTPVDSLTELKAITAPADGEQRQVKAAGDFVVYYYRSDATSPAVICDDGSAGGWNLTVPISTSEYWEADKEYVANDAFLIELSVDCVDHEGNEVVANKLYEARYVDSNGVAADTLSGATLDCAEVAKMEIEAGEVPSVSVITQTETDADILIN